MSIIDDYSPIAPGDTLVPFTPVFQHKDRTPVNLTGCTIAMQMRNQETGVTRTCEGTWAIDDAAKGKAHYDYQSVDVNTAGTFDMIITISKGGKPVHADVKELLIKTP